MGNLWEPLRIGDVTLKNRIVFAPASLGSGAEKWYERLALGGCGLIVMADLSVASSMLGAPALDSMKWEKWFRDILTVCHRYDCKVSAQLFYPEYDVEEMTKLYRMMRMQSERGFQADARQMNVRQIPEICSRQIQEMTPQQVRQELNRSVEEYCDRLSEEKIAQIIGCFEAAAERARRIGFDMVQVHGDRLIGSFSSPLFNHRTDKYGRYDCFAAEVVKAVKRGAGEMPVDYKLTIRTEEPAYGRGGISENQIPKFVKCLENCGVDSFHVTLANHTATKDTIPQNGHPYFDREGCFVELARMVRRCTDKPICCVGRIQNAETAERLCCEGMDLIGMCRQLIADPEWGNKVRDGRMGEIRKCRYCNVACAGALRQGKAVGCILDMPASDRQASSAEVMLR